MNFPEGSVEGMFFGLPKGWEDIVTDSFRAGRHIAQAFTAIGLTATEHEKLMKLQEYYEVFINGMALSEIFWMEWAMQNLNDPKVNTKLFELMTKRLFNWDKKIDKLAKDDSEDKVKVQGEISKFKETYLKQ